MIKPVLGALGLLTGLAAMPAPLAAQAGQKALIIYGNDKCPTNRAGEEVVVCARRPESERYRIPSELREGTAGSSNNGAAVSAMATGGTGGSSTCSNVGGGGGNNCFANQMRAAKAERRQAKAEKANSPEPQ